MEIKRLVMIGTPAYDGKVTVQYADSMRETILTGLNQGIKVVPVYGMYNAVIQLVRNNLFSIAKNSNVDDLVFIDSDIGWNTEDFFKLLFADKDVHIVGGAYRKKKDESEEYALSIKNISKIKSKNDRLIEVEGLGMGFTRFDKYAINKLWKSSKKYMEENGEKRSIFEVIIRETSIFSEDISLCLKWSALKEKIYLDKSINCKHIGYKEYLGNFNNFLENNIFNMRRNNMKKGRDVC